MHVGQPDSLPPIVAGRNRALAQWKEVSVPANIHSGTTATRRGSETTCFWRVSATTKANLDLAVEAAQWGARALKGIHAVQAGDWVALYVIEGRDSGYWGIARVTRAPFLSHTVVWADDAYPARFAFKLDRAVRSKPVTRAQVMAQLGTRRLTYFRRAGVIRLTTHEFETIRDLLTETPTTKEPSPRGSRRRRLG